VIGYGYWGPNLVRNFHETSGAQVTGVADRNPQRLELMRSRYPDVKALRNEAELLSDPAVDAVVIATPASSHADLAIAALRAGKHVLVEKPMAETSAKCRVMIDEAQRAGRTLMVDHVFPFAGAVRKIRELIQGGELGEIYYYDSTRVNLGLFQHDVSVIWDLAVHDLAIIDYILTERPVAVSCTGISHMKGQTENVAYLTLFFATNTIAHIHVNWLAPVKLRRTLIGGSRKMIVYDDLEPTEKIKVYDRGVTLETNPDSIHELNVGYRTGDMWAPKTDASEALRLLARHFIDCIAESKTPITSAESGCRVVRIMEAASESMARHGEMVRIEENWQ
jgi:predicted dehydrogenase